MVKNNCTDFYFTELAEINTPLGQKCLLDLIKLKQDGYVKKIGVSIYSPSELSKVLDVFTPDLIQFPLIFLINECYIMIILIA